MIIGNTFLETALTYSGDLIELFKMRIFMPFSNEFQFESYIRHLIGTHITTINKNIFALTNKKAVDIVICKDGVEPHLYFLEVKFHMKKHGRLGFGGGKGSGFQPEILTKRPSYFERNLRWVVGAEHTNLIYFLSSELLVKYLSGGGIGEKFNNIQRRLFDDHKGLTEDEFVTEMKSWIK